MLEGDDEHSLKYLLFSVAKKVIVAAPQKLSSMAFKHMHPLTDNDKVVSLPKKSILRFHNIHVFQNFRNTI